MREVKGYFLWRFVTSGGTVDKFIPDRYGEGMVLAVCERDFRLYAKQVEAAGGRASGMLYIFPNQKALQAWLTNKQVPTMPDYLIIRHGDKVRLVTPRPAPSTPSLVDTQPIFVDTGQ